MNVHSMKLTKDEEDFCEAWLSKWGMLLPLLPNTDEFTEQVLSHLVYYEAKSYRRQHVIKRLYGRYNAVRRDRELKEITQWTKQSRR